MAQVPAGFPSAIRVRIDGCIVRWRFAMIPPPWPIMLRHPTPLGISGGKVTSGAVDEANSGAVGGFRFPPVLRIAKGPACRDIVTAKDPPSRQFQWAIYVHISELRPWSLKMGRKNATLIRGLAPSQLRPDGRRISRIYYSTPPGSGYPVYWRGSSAETGTGEAP